MTTSGRNRIATLEAEVISLTEKLQDVGAREFVKQEMCVDMSREIATLEAARDTAVERVGMLEGAISGIMTGGNHLASALIGWLGGENDTFPPYSTSFEDARKIIANIDHYDAWVCWKCIMEARDKVDLYGRYPLQQI